MDSFFTIAGPVESEIREKSSKFLTFAYPIETENEAESALAALWKLHAKASHICYAYRLGIGGQIYRVNDDGEPSGTAGKPIFGQLISHDLTDIAMFVVRYFGGTKLGTGGLINAYKESANLAIKNARIIQKYVYNQYLLNFNYESMGVILNALKILAIEIIDKNFSENPNVSIIIKRDEAEVMIRKIKARLLEFELERIDDDTEVDFCKVEFIKEVKQ